MQTVTDQRASQQEEEKFRIIVACVLHNNPHNHNHTTSHTKQ